MPTHDDKDKLENIGDALGSIVAPTTAGDTQSMLKAIQNAALIRAGIGILGQRRMGESGFDATARVLKDVSQDVTKQVSTITKLQKDAMATKLAATKEKRSLGKDALTIYEKLYFRADPVTGTMKQKDTDLMAANIPPPSQELFKNELLDLYLADQGAFDALKKVHIRAVKQARDQGQTHDWEDTVAQYKNFINQ